MQIRINGILCVRVADVSECMKMIQCQSSVSVLTYVRIAANHIAHISDLSQNLII